MKIIYTSKFERGYKKLPNHLKDAAEVAERIFKKDPFDTKLDTHKLHGKMKDFWSFSINCGHRIIFEFSKDKKLIYFHAVGNHDIYR